jgi:DNA-binding MarR family transcriptional regulator
MRPDLSTSVPAGEAADSTGAGTGWGEIAQRMLTQVVVGRRCQRAILAALDKVQLTDTQLLVLWGIDQILPASAGSGVGQSEIAQSLGISPAQVSGLVEQLRQLGDLDCQRAANDRRQQLWHLTAAGRERLQRALQTIATLDVNLLAWPEATLGIPSVKPNHAPSIQVPASAVSRQHGEAA